MVFQCINIRLVPREVLKTTASGLGFQHLPRDLVNVNAWKNMFDPCIISTIPWLYATTKAFYGIGTKAVRLFGSFPFYQYSVYSVAEKSVW